MLRFQINFKGIVICQALVMHSRKSYCILGHSIQFVSKSEREKFPYLAKCVRLGNSIFKKLLEEIQDVMSISRPE